MRGSAIATSSLAVLLAVAVPRAGQAQPRGEDDSAELVTAGRRALQAGDLKAAAKALDQAIALNPRRIEAYALRAAVHAARGEHDRGVALMRKARELAPTSADVLTALGTSSCSPARSTRACPSSRTSSTAPVIATRPTRCSVITTLITIAGRRR